MKKICSSLEKILEEELGNGNSLQDVIPNYNSTLKLAFFMKNPMSKNTFKNHSNSKDKFYTYLKYDGSPQNPPDEGFIDKETKEAIVFPR